MGKSSLLVRTRHLLQQQGTRCSTLDMSRIGSENITPVQWYKGVISELCRDFQLLGKIHLKSWWREQEDFPIIQRLSNFLEDVLLAEFTTEKLVIFIDEIDSILSLNFSIDDFFALIRFCYNQRAINPEYNRLTFALFGVATPSDLIADKKRTPFNLDEITYACEWVQDYLRTNLNLSQEERHLCDRIQQQHPKSNKQPH